MMKEALQKHKPRTQAGKSRRRRLWKAAALGCCAALCLLAVAGREAGRHPDKLWLHRCNSLEKLEEKGGDYPNIEVDLVFRPDRTFDVTHDMETSFGLRLDAYFARMADMGGGGIWLDIKNLDNNNASAMLAALNALAARYGMAKGRLIVESPDWHSLGKFKRDGYYTSCYVTYPIPRKLDQEETNSCIAELRKVADSGNVCALSFPGPWYTVLKERLGRPIDLLTWKHRTTRLELFLTPVGWKMVRDPQLKVILVKDKGKYHR